MTGPKATELDIRYAYRLLLGREPDPDGLATFGRYIVENAALDFDTGSGPADRIVSTYPHTASPVLKFWLGDFVSTSIGIIVTRAAAD